MLRDRIENTAVENEYAPTWTSEAQRRVEPRWRTVDRALREIAVRRAALDADEARWLREAEALQIWRPLGMVSALDYLERILGYAPRTAQDKLRVARALGALPQLTAALANGVLPSSAVRELTRVATRATEAAWIASATGKTLRQIEELVADHRLGPERRTLRVASRWRPLPSRRLPVSARTRGAPYCPSRRRWQPRCLEPRSAVLVMPRTA
jgi:hypothetical protein